MERNLKQEIFDLKRYSFELQRAKKGFPEPRTEQLLELIFSGMKSAYEQAIDEYGHVTKLSFSIDFTDLDGNHPDIEPEELYDQYGDEYLTAFESSAYNVYGINENNCIDIIGEIPFYSVLDQEKLKEFPTISLGDTIAFLRKNDMDVSIDNSFIISADPYLPYVEYSSTKEYLGQARGRTYKK